MSDALLSQVEQALRSGKADLALQAARQQCSGDGPAKDHGLALAKIAASVYRDFITPPVVEFVNAAPEYLPEEAGTLVQKAVGRLFRLQEEWEKKLWDVHTERLTRELRDWLRGRHLDPCAANIARLMALAEEPQRGRRAQFIGNVLGTVINNQKEAAQLLKLLEKRPKDYFLTPEQVRAMDAARQKRHGELGGADLENLERQWYDTLTSTAVEIKGLLPSASQMGDPEEATLRDVGDAFRNLLRPAIVSEELDLFLDATNVLVDFVPKEQTATAALARVEGRTYHTLGFTAQKAVQLTFLELGKNPLLTRLYGRWAENYRNTDELKQIVEFMGALRTTAFNDFLKSVKGQGGGSMEQRVASALGSIADEAAADELMTDLRGVLSKKRLDMADLKKAERLIKGLGAVVRSQRSDIAERRKIREFLRSHVPDDLTKLAAHTALAAFSFKADEQTPEQRQWAIKAMVRGLWMSDDSTALHKGGDEADPLAGRGELVTALLRIAAGQTPMVIKAMEPLTSRYGAAYIAASDLLEKLGSQETIPLLERMLNNTLLHDDAHQSAYQQEYIWDPAAQERKPVTKDMVLEPIVHAIGALGGPQAQAVLRRYREQISSGRVASPTTNIAQFLEQYMEGGASQEDLEVGANGLSMDAVPLEAADVPDLIKVLKKRYLLTGKAKRRAKKVSALTRLAQLTPLDAVDIVFKQLADKDIMVVSAAISCLAEYASTKQQKAVKDLTVNTCLEALESRDPAMRKGAAKVLVEIGPNRKDVKERILQFLKMTESKQAREAIAEALKSGGGAPTSSDLEGGEEASSPGADRMAKLELKRQYMEARQAWIRNGKKGDPPVKPEGID